MLLETGVRSSAVPIHWPVIPTKTGGATPTMASRQRYKQSITEGEPDPSPNFVLSEQKSAIGLAISTQFPLPLTQLNEHADAIS